MWFVPAGVGRVGSQDGGGGGDRRGGGVIVMATNRILEGSFNNLKVLQLNPLGTRKH